MENTAGEVGERGSNSVKSGLLKSAGYDSFHIFETKSLQAQASFLGMNRYLMTAGGIHERRKPPNSDSRGSIPALKLNHFG